MARSIKGIVVGIPVAVFVFLVVLYFSFNSILKAGVEAVGPRVLGADVALEQVSISMLSGKGQLKGIVIGNPEGFHTERAFKLGEVRVDVDLLSILSDKIVINEIVIDSPEITYETAVGTNNINALLENINNFVGKSEGDADGSTEAASAESEGKIQINDFIINNARVNVSASILKGKKLTLPLADIHIEDIGKDEGGATMSDALGEVFTVLNKNIAGAVAVPLESAGKTFQKTVEKTVEKAVDKLKGLFGK